ncbi:2-oxo-4-hydroxy-4-carboxy-5-ureidoimidazoline decarboxylase [Streptomyces sp. KM273126]|uniref:2-oxo-4-hydroxy-4-carboxy-5-ureidoimidazoline decarboxylase n=1 Tax=Streptomyces sp. KM273126 TaxID=2545247 RepID=UPI0015EC3A5F|nr:2-oxo-4-hydroxy-4-carboxy-5-ureidoimidazoline decarboxylase [Streptomyces sp. KM273126]MBA2808513.1 2-oxo-4-hydroxy-4-carboxy-5-ureidoimidazoline decarboxylase [Streptomyces sp. KM273126]
MTAHLTPHPQPTRTRGPQDLATHRRGPTLPSHRLPHLPGQVAFPEQPRTAPGPMALEGFNTAPATDAEQALLTCCRSPRWAHRVAEHRPYPDLEALLAAADEASYDLTPADVAEALAAESLTLLPAGAYSAAHTALSAAHAAYESRFGHVFVICLDDIPAAEALDRVLTGIRSRLTNDPEEERLLAAEELRRLARGRLRRIVGDFSSQPVP